jgi:sugar/nucleoside kinase (ribokinase family)
MHGFALRYNVHIVSTNGAGDVDFNGFLTAKHAKGYAEIAELHTETICEICASVAEIHLCLLSRRALKENRRARRVAQLSILRDQC